jgi:hypothetical protein
MQPTNMGTEPKETDDVTIRDGTTTQCFAKWYGYCWSICFLDILIPNVYTSILQQPHEEGPLPVDLSLLMANRFAPP